MHAIFQEVPARAPFEQRSMVGTVGSGRKPGLTRTASGKPKYVALVFVRAAGPRGARTTAASLAAVASPAGEQPWPATDVGTSPERSASDTADVAETADATVSAGVPPRKVAKRTSFAAWMKKEAWSPYEETNEIGRAHV